MKSKIINILLMVFFAAPILLANETATEKADSLSFRSKQEILVTSSRLPIPSKDVTQASSLVLSDIFKTAPRTIGAEEAMRLVPGVRVENQANGSRVHLSIRGQGILTERGLRGINVIIDGIPMNDPTGFAHDLFDVDWASVNKIEVLRGPTASFYGSGGSAGVLNIITESGKEGGIGGFNKEVSSNAGSNGFLKTRAQVDGKTKDLDYRISFSKMQGDGYRDHSAYWGNILSEKINWKASDKVSISQIFMAADYFNQNAEGLSIDQVKENPLQANPDAVPFNEYQKTNRITNGITGQIKFDDNSDLQFNGFMRWSKYKETSNKAAQYRSYTTPGAGLQYNLKFGGESVKSVISIGTELRWQNIAEHKFKSMSDTSRKDNGCDEKNLESKELLANQTIDQSLAGVYALYNLSLSKKLNFNASVRYDKIHNELADKLNQDSLNLSGNADFENMSAKIGASYEFADEFNIYANWGTGFIPPSTEELVNNPASFGGFNTNLKPATSKSQEIGFRGFINEYLSYDITGFYMTTEKDFFRFKLYPARGTQEVFYGNAGNSRRYGLETFLVFKPIENLNIQIAYTYSNFKYNSPDSLNGVWVPNSPEHQLNFDIQYDITENLSVGANSTTQSKWYIYTDAVHKNLSQAGFTLLDARIQYKLDLFGCNAIVSINGRNLTNQKWIAFTEPDPDGNCYQPGAGREFFCGLAIRF